MFETSSSEKTRAAIHHGKKRPYSAIGDGGMLKESKLNGMPPWKKILAMRNSLTLMAMDDVGEITKQIMLHEASEQVAVEQVRISEETCRCGVCYMNFDNEEERDNCLDAIETRLKTIRAKKQNAKNLGLVKGVPKVSVNKAQLRLGYVVNIRQLKAAMLSKKKCPGCKKDLENAYLGELLSRLDRFSAALTSR